LVFFYSSVFQSLGEMSEDKDLGYNIKQSQERAYFCTEVTRKVETKIAVTKKLLEQRVKRMEEVREAQEREDMELVEGEKERGRIERERQEGIERQRRELADRMREGNEMMVVDEERGAGSGVKRARKKKDKVVEEAVEESDGERVGKRMKLSKKYVVSSDEDL
jgi:hypothetical protein